MNDDKYDLKHSNKVIKRMNKEMKQIKEEILKDKTPEEQERIKKQWEQNEIETNRKLKKELERYEKQREEWNKRQSELMTTEDIKQGLKDMIKKLDDEWDETLQSTIDELCKGKTDEEKAKIIKSFENSFNKGE